MPNQIREKDLIGIADHRVLFASEEINIAKWWNLGLDYITKHARHRHEVLAISSDHVGTDYSVAKLGTFLREENLVMAGPNYWGDFKRFFDTNTTPHVHHRVPGGCWMIKGEYGLRLDENFRWWYSDDDLDMHARQVGRTGQLPNTGLMPGPDSELSAEKQQWAIEDREKFIKKWNRQPW